MNLLRVVRMTFEEKYIEDFITNFEENKQKIRHFEGCNHLELWQDAHNPCIFLTYSHWESEEKLNNYRKSQLFGEVWAKTKQWFSEKPIAFSSFQKILVE